MAEVLELEVKASVSGASNEFKDLNNTVKESISEVEELNQQLEIQTEVVNNLETALLKMKQQQSVNSDYENSVSGLNQKIKETTVELQLEKQALKTLRAERKAAVQGVKSLEKAQKQQVTQAFAGIKHFQIMGVSLRRLRLMVRAIIPSFKLMFKTIRVGIASTGIGLLVIALGSVFAAMTQTNKGAAAFKKIMKGIGDLLQFLMQPFLLLGDAILTLLGVEEDGTSKAVDKVAQAFANAEKEMKRLEQQEHENTIAREKYNQEIDKGTLSFEEQLETAQKLVDQEKDNAQAKFESAQKTKVLADAEVKKLERWLAWDKKTERGKDRIAQVEKMIAKAKKDQIKANEKLNKQELKLVQVKGAGESEIRNLIKNNNKKTQDEENNLASKRKQWRDARKKGEEKVAAIIEKINQEIAIEELETDEEKEKKKLEFKMEKIKEDVKNSKASEKSKTEALKKIEDDYQQDLQQITDKYAEKNKEKLEKEDEKLKAIRDQNTLSLIEDEEKRAQESLRIQQENEIARLGDIENFEEMKLAIEKKYQIKAEQLAKKSEQNQKKMDAAKLQSQLGAFSKLTGSLQALAGENKELAAAQAIIDTYAGANKAFAQGGTTGFVTGAAIILQGLANVKRIYATDVGDGGGGGGANIDAPAQPPAQQLMQGAFTLGQGQAPDPIKAFVVTDEMTNSQNQLANIRRRATI